MGQDALCLCFSGGTACLCAPELRLDAPEQKQLFKPCLPPLPACLPQLTELVKQRQQALAQVRLGVSWVPALLRCRERMHCARQSLCLNIVKTILPMQVDALLEQHVGEQQQAAGQQAAAGPAAAKQK